jgi:hypothetical protein
MANQRDLRLAVMMCSNTDARESKQRLEAAATAPEHRKATGILTYSLRRPGDSTLGARKKNWSSLTLQRAKVECLQ